MTSRCHGVSIYPATSSYLFMSREIVTATSLEEGLVPSQIFVGFNTEGDEALPFHRDMEVGDEVPPEQDDGGFDSRLFEVNNYCRIFDGCHDAVMMHVRMPTHHED